MEESVQPYSEPIVPMLSWAPSHIEHSVICTVLNNKVTNLIYRVADIFMTHSQLEPTNRADYEVSVTVQLMPLEERIEHGIAFEEKVAVLKFINKDAKRALIIRVGSARDSYLFTLFSNFELDEDDLKPKGSCVEFTADNLSAISFVHNFVLLEYAYRFLETGATNMNWQGTEKWHLH